jgi:hypothetical protein
MPNFVFTSWPSEYVGSRSAWGAVRDRLRTFNAFETLRQAVSLPTHQTLSRHG